MPLVMFMLSGGWSGLNLLYMSMQMPTLFYNQQSLHKTQVYVPMRTDCSRRKATLFLKLARERSRGAT